QRKALSHGTGEWTRAAWRRLGRLGRLDRLDRLRRLDRRHVGGGPGLWRTVLVLARNPPRVPATLAVRPRHTARADVPLPPDRAALIARHQRQPTGPLAEPGHSSPRRLRLSG